MKSSFFDQILYDLIFSYLHIPYVYGGEFPGSGGGFDCSGFVIDVLQSAAILPNKFDTTAQGLLDLLEKAPGSRIGVRGLGSIVFYGKSTSGISHVGIMVDPYRIAEAGGGDSTVTTIEEARRRDARIRIRPIDYRKDRISIIRPSYVKIGENI